MLVVVGASGTSVVIVDVLRKVALLGKEYLGVWDAAVYREERHFAQASSRSSNNVLKVICCIIAAVMIKKTIILMAAQDQAITTDAVKVEIREQRESPLCRMCKEKEECTGHAVIDCSKIAQTPHKGRHHIEADAAHWSLCSS